MITVENKTKWSQALWQTRWIIEDKFQLVNYEMNRAHTITGFQVLDITTLWMRDGGGWGSCNMKEEQLTVSLYKTVPNHSELTLI